MAETKSRFNPNAKGYDGDAGDASGEYTSRFNPQGVAPPPPLDERTGASVRARAAVGIARSPEDRLSTLRRFYPDAQPYENGSNFVFTNPETKRPTLYNPPGLINDPLGTIASIGPEISEVLGGSAGAAAVVPTVVPTLGASSLAAPFAYGLGAAGGRELYEQAAGRFLGTDDTRTLGRQASDVAVTTGLNAVAPRVGEVAISAAKKFVPPVFNKAFPGFAQSREIGRQRARDFRATGVPATAGTGTGSSSFQMIESGLANTPGGAGVFQRQAEDVVKSVKNNIDNLATRINGGRPLPTASQIGDTIQEGAKDAGKRFAATRSRIDDELETLIGSDTMVPLPNVKAAISSLRSQLEGGKTSLSESLSPAISKLEGLVLDASANGGLIPFKVLRSVRSALGANLDRPDVSGFTPSADRALRQAYGALAEEIKAAAKTAGPRALQKLKLHDRYVRFNRNITLPFLDKVAKQDTPEKVWSLAMQSSKDGGTNLSRLRRSLKPDEWDYVVSGVLNRMGKANPGQQGPVDTLSDAGQAFSVPKFLTSFKTLSVEARNAMFGQTRFKDYVTDLDRIVRVVSHVKDADKMANPSGTARNLGIQLSILSALGAVGTTVVTGSTAPLGIAAASVATYTVAPNLAARLMTSPRFVGWLTKSINATDAPSAFGRSVSRLAAVVEAEPELEDAVGAYVEALERTLSKPKDDASMVDALTRASSSPQPPDAEMSPMARALAPATLNTR